MKLRSHFAFSVFGSPVLRFSSCWRWLFACGVLLALSSGALAKDKIDVVVDASLGGPSALALADLERAFQTRGLETSRRTSLADNGWQVVVGRASVSKIVDQLLSEQRIPLSKQAESLCLQRIKQGQSRVLLIAGADERGLSYALLDAARAIEFSASAGDPFQSISEAVETPFLRVRSMTVHPFNAELDADWYFDENFWRGYFTRLARDRFNNLSLTFSDQTNYLNPLYAYTVDVPQFPQVRVRGLTADGRRRNLSMLRRIAELAAERGLDFTLGIWMQAPVPAYDGAVLVENLPTGSQAAEYCAAGLKQILQACPAITGVQFRMNDEAGVHPDQQTAFYRPLFQAVRECGRPVRLDLRYKGLQPATTQAAIDSGLDVTVSTKFWCEHMGLPYHPTVSDSHYRASRYSFGTMLAKPRPYRVVYRLWSVGSQRLLLWGDPDYASRFAQSCRLGDGEGFEVFSPLTNKGYGDRPGRWRIFARPADEHFTWEHERYWLFSLVFGRMGYNPQCAPEVWQREFRHRFGDAAAEMEAAYRSGSRVLPLITASRLLSASEWRWWPEMDTGGALIEYMHTPPSDTGQFYGIRAWKPTAKWGGDAWDQTNAGYVEDVVAGRFRGKTTPLEVSRQLRELAEETERRLDAALAKSRDSRSVELTATERDLRVAAQLARYHSEKTQAATHLAFFELTKEAGRLPKALQHARAAAEAWQRIVQITDGVYHDNLVFGILRDTERSRLGLHHSGHWKDRLAEVRADVAFVEQLLKQHGGDGQTFRVFPGETPRTENITIEHTPATVAHPAKDLLIAARVTSDSPLQSVVLHYRPLDQTANWKQVTMTRDRDSVFQTTLYSRELTERWDMQYYFEVLTEHGGRLWPTWEQDQPFVVTRVTRNPPAAP